MPAWHSARRLGSRRPSEAGWTLLEVLVVLSLVMVITAVAMSSRSTSVNLGREAALRANLQMMRDAIDQFYADTARYPHSLDELVSAGYMRGIPEDPFTNSNATWEEEPPPAGRFGQGGRPRDGVYQVRSGSSHVGLDGTRVSEW
jgi:general secretion pathway protein G